MDDYYADGMRLKNTLSHEVYVTQTSRGVQRRQLALSACSQVQLARVDVRVLVLVDVVCVMLVVLIARVDIHAVNIQFS